MENESIEKILRAVLQSCKGGISVRSLQAEYHSFCGESLPLKRLGYQTLEEYLKSIPSVVRLDHRMGELMCFARVCEETAHIAELVARQKTSKKPARSWTARSGMRFKPPDPYLSNGISRSFLKQPSCRPSGGPPSSSSKPRLLAGSRNGSASGVYRQMKQEIRPSTQVQHRPTAAPPAVKQTDALNRIKPSMDQKKESDFQHGSRQSQFQSCPYVAAEVQKNMKQLLNKYTNGLWVSRLSEVYREMFHQDLHPQALTDLERWTNICFVEKSASEKRADRVIYPLLLSQLKTLINPLFVNVLYQGVCVSNVCTDGTLYCRLPSPGAFRLTKMLEEIDASGISQMTPELLVSKPFIGKFCLARFRGKWARAEITNMFGDMMLEVLFLDFAVPVTAELSSLREIPPPFLKDFGFIPPQAVKCRLADVDAPGVDWSPEAVVWLREKVLETESCKVKILKLEETKWDRVAYIHVFVGGDGLQQNSINHQLVQLFQRAQSSRGGNLVDAAPTFPVRKRTHSDPTLNWPVSTSPQSSHNVIPTMTLKPLALPAPLQLPEPGQSMDVFVVVACHPGYFVVQPWRDLDHLEALMWRMSLFYRQREACGTVTDAQAGDVCAAKINQQWYRVQIKRVLANGFVSVYELDYGQQELVQKSLIQPLVEQFRQLPFQAVPAQLAGVTQHQWSEAASMLFRNRVERRALVAQVESVQDVLEVKGEPWRRQLTAYLVDTTLEDEDLWIHCFMADME